MQKPSFSKLIATLIVAMIFGAGSLSAQNPPDISCSLAWSSYQYFTVFQISGESGSINYSASSYNNQDIINLKGDPYIIEVKPDVAYNFLSEGYPDPGATYTSYLSIFVDYNRDGAFTIPQERLIAMPGAYTHKDAIKFAASELKFGLTLVRVVNDYSDVATVQTGCGSSSWGQAIDFYINYKDPGGGGGGGDPTKQYPHMSIAGNTITQPPAQFTPGIYNVAVTVTNSSETKDLSSVTFDWFIDGVSQGQVFRQITPALKIGESREVVVGQYNFQYKPGFGTYAIDVIATSPNGIAEFCDGAQAYHCLDNMADTRYISPAMTPGTYYVGGNAPHFPTLQDAILFINASGVLGNGSVNFMVRPGTYEGSMNFTTTGISGNPINIIGESGDPSDVIVKYDAGYNPDTYLFDIQNVSNVNVENITFEVTWYEYNGEGGYETAIYSAPAGLLNFANNSNITVNNNIFIGLDDVQNTNDLQYVSLNLFNTKNVDVTNNQFYGGAVAINDSVNNAAACARNLLISDNLFSTFGSRGVILANNICSQSYVEVTNNDFIGGSVVTPKIGLYSRNSDLLVKGNNFSSFNGAGQTNNAAISILSTNNFAETVDITENTIAQVQNMNGIFVQDADNVYISMNDVVVTFTTVLSRALTVIQSAVPFGTADIYSNNIIVSRPSVPVWLESIENLTFHYNDVDFSNATLNGVYANLCSGIMANNTISTNGEGLRVVNGTMHLFHNTVSTNSNTLPAVVLQNNVELDRNIFQNLGTNYALQIFLPANFTGSSQNVFYTAGTTFAWYNGTLVPTLAALRTLVPTIDQNNNSITQQTLLFSTTDLRLNKYYPNIVWDYPLFPDTDWRHLAFEVLDFEVMDREGNYYAGADNVQPEITIINQPKPVVECVGTEELNLYAVASATDGVLLQHQWYKDGVAIPYNTGILYFDQLAQNGDVGIQYYMTGVYHCEIFGAGAPRVVSEPVLVNVLRPLEITRQPGNKIVDQGGDLFWEVEVHLHGDLGLDDPLLNPDFQWYKNTTPPTPIVDDQQMGGRFAGANSSILSIRDVQESDYTVGYYVVITGECGSVTSDVSMLYKTPSVEITSDPSDLKVCEEGLATFGVGVNQTGAPMQVHYQWRWNGVNLEENDYFVGVNTSTLTILEAMTDFAGEFDCLVWLHEMAPMTSVKAVLTVDPLPMFTAQPMDTEVKLGEMLELMAGVEYANTYEWYRNNELVLGANSATLTIDATVESDAGEYYCVATNDCGQRMSSKAMVKITTDGGTTDVNDVVTGGLYMVNTPNPFTDATTIEFSVPTQSRVTLTIIDASGNEVATIFNKDVAGLQRIQFNANDYNLTSGVYYCTISANGNKLTQQMVIVK